MMPTITTTRSALVLAALQRAIVERRTSIDAGTDIGEITVTIKLKAGQTRIRSVMYAEERIDLKGM